MRKILWLVLFSVLFVGNLYSQEQKTIKGGIVNGKAIELPKPEYPESAKTLNIKGKVVVNILVDENGNVEAAKIVSGHPLFHKVCIEAAMQTKYKQITLSGKPVKVTSTLVYNFL